MNLCHVGILEKEHIRFTIRGKRDHIRRRQVLLLHQLARETQIAGIYQIHEIHYIGVSVRYVTESVASRILIERGAPDDK